MKFFPSEFDADGNLITFGSKFYSDWDDFDVFPANPHITIKGLLKAARNVIGEALARLDAIPRVDDDHIAVPWPIVKRPRTDAWEWSVLDSVKIESLHATQDLLTVDRVRFYVKNPGSIEEGRRAFANVYDSSGTLAIVDGHHRLAALWLLGADEALVWMLREDS